MTKLIFKVKIDGATKAQTFEGFGSFSGSRHALAVRQDGEWEFYDWDGTEEGVDELGRMFRLTTGQDPDTVVPFINGFLAAEERRLEEEETLNKEPSDGKQEQDQQNEQGEGKKPTT